MRLWESTQASPAHTVRKDWRAELTSDKDKAFRYGIELIEPLHYMFGVALNDAIGLRNNGNLDLAREQVRVTINLCHRCVESLSALLLTLERHARHFGTLPSVEPLDSENFQGEAARSRARMSFTLSMVLWGQQSLYLHKVKDLGRLISDQDELYAVTAERVAGGYSVFPKFDWDVLDGVHYDLTTAVSEAKILLKCFLVAVPEGEVRHFHRQVASATLFAADAEANGRAAAFLRQ